MSERCPNVIREAGARVGRCVLGEGHDRFCQAPTEQARTTRSRVRSMRVFSAWLISRAERYDQSSGTYALLEELAEMVREGEPVTAHKHGELDAILKRLR